MRDYNCARYSECLRDAAILNLPTLHCERCHKEERMTIVIMPKSSEKARPRADFSHVTRRMMRNCGELFTTG